MATTLKQCGFRPTHTQVEQQAKLIDHVLEVCHYMFQKYTISMHVPILPDYRLFMLLQHLIWFELFHVMK